MINYLPLNTVAIKTRSLWARVFPIELEFGSVGRKTLEARTRTNNKLSPHMTPGP